MKIGIITGSIRDGRLGEAVGQWVTSLAQGRDSGVEYVSLDIKSFDLPLLDAPEHPMMTNKQYGNAQVQAWSDAVDACDAFVFVTAEYNHSVPGGFKNAVDSLGAEWVGKPVGFVGYGSVGGVRAIEHWRQILANFSAPTVRSEVNLSLFTDFGENGFAPAERHTDIAQAMFTELEALAGTLRG